MSLEASEVRVAGTGHIWRAPVGTAFPANISTVVDETLYTELGYTSVDGVKFSFGRDVAEVDAWQSRDALRIITKATPRTVEAKFLQMNENTWNTAMGGGTWTTPTPGNYLYQPPAADYEDVFTYIVESHDGALKYRWCFRNVQNISGVDVELKRTDATMLPIVVKVLAADGGLPPYDFQTNDANLGDYAQAGS